MKKWLMSLSKNELKVWIKNMSSPLILFLATDEDKENLKLARQVLKDGKNV